MFGALTLLGIPFAEYLLLRITYRELLGFSPGFPGITDYDIVPPAFIAGIALYFALERFSKIPFSFQRPGLIFHLIVGLMLIPLTILAIREENASAHSAVYWIWLSANALFLCSAGFIWTSPSYLIQHPQKKLLLAAFFVAASKVLGRGFLNAFWTPVATFTGKTCYLFLSPFFPELTLRPWVSGPNLFSQLRLPGLTLSIGSGCSGLEGIFLFLTLWAFIFLWRSEKHSGTSWIFSFITGTFFMYLMNVLRICLFCVISRSVVIHFRRQTGVATALTLFHNGIGWILYSIAIYFFFRAFSAVASSSDVPDKRSFLWKPRNA